MNSDTTERMKIKKQRTFLNEDVDLTVWKNIEPYFDLLRTREINSGEELEQIIKDLDELGGALREVNARMQIAASIDTSNKNVQEALNNFQETVVVKEEEYSKDIISRFINHPLRYKLDPALYSHLEKIYLNRLSLYCEENLPLFAKDQNLAQKHASIIGGISIEFDGKKQNLAKMGTYQKEPDRKIRHKAWLESTTARFKKSEEIDLIFDDLIKLRHQQALNAGFGNFRDYKHQSLQRFDYTPADCIRFHESIEKYAVPLMKRVQQYRLKKLGLKKLFPWDLSVNPDNKPPLKPFKNENEFIAGTAAVLDAIYPHHGNRLRTMKQEGNLDLSTRENKALVGYNTVLDESDSSFIFMNSVGFHSDLNVLVHEAGHAIEKYSCRNQPFLQYRSAPSEWAELASQSHEHLALDHLDVLYDSQDDIKSCKAAAMESLIMFFPRVAKIDAFQHWVYLNPEHSHQERHEKWEELCIKYDGIVNWEEVQKFRGSSWQPIPHLFFVPFYYIEYGIAQLGALQVWRNVRENGQSAMEQFLKALQSGFSKQIPSLYSLAGIRFEFFGEFVSYLFRFIEDEYFANVD